MGRTVAYDRDQVIARARNLFWTKGFDAVSVADVEQVTGLSRSSIYHAFTNMRGLFDAAVDDYLDVVVRPRLRPLQGDDVAREALHDYLLGLADGLARLHGAGGPDGCLLVATTGTTLGADSAVREVVAAYHAELRGAITAGLAARHPRVRAKTLAAAAASVTGSVVAAMTLARVDLDAATELLTVTANFVEDGLTWQ